VIEDPEHAAAFVREVADRLQPSTLYISSGSDLELLGEQVARKKVEVLGEVGARLREDLS
jgi:methionine synthase II (cobalamin-independent)